MAVLFLPSFESRNGIHVSVDTAWCSSWKDASIAGVAICGTVELTSCHMAILHDNPRKLHVHIIVRHKKKMNDEAPYSIRSLAMRVLMGEGVAEFCSHIEQRNLLHRTWIGAFFFDFFLDFVADKGRGVAKYTLFPSVEASSLPQAGQAEVVLIYEKMSLITIYLLFP